MDFIAPLRALLIRWEGVLGIEPSLVVVVEVLVCKDRKRVRRSDV